MPAAEPTGDFPLSARDFNTTHWSVVLLAGNSSAPQAGAALENLCRAYWPPLYAYVRRQGHGPHDAQDLTQEFFARLLEKDYFKLADRERGRFRSFLLKSLQHFLVNDWARGQAQKRGGGQRVLSLDEESAERAYLEHPAEQFTPETLYEKRWAMLIVERTMQDLAREYESTGKGAIFHALKGLMLIPATGEAYLGIAGPLGVSEGAIKVALHRLRQRFRDAVRAEVARTVERAEDVDEELRCLMAALGN